MSLELLSPAFSSGGAIPEEHSKDGGNNSPPLVWSDTPETTRSFALIVDDPDAPSGVFVHWLLYDIPSTAAGVESRMPRVEELPDGSRQGTNGFGDLGYGGPRPPSGTHRYFFHLYGLDDVLDLEPGEDREALERAMKGHILEEAELMGTYQHREPGTQAA